MADETSLFLCSVVFFSANYTVCSQSVGLELRYALHFLHRWQRRQQGCHREHEQRRDDVSTIFNAELVAILFLPKIHCYIYSMLHKFCCFVSIYSYTYIHTHTHTHRNNNSCALIRYQYVIFIIDNFKMTVNEHLLRMLNLLKSKMQSGTVSLSICFLNSQTFILHT